MSSLAIVMHNPHSIKILDSNGKTLGEMTVSDAGLSWRPANKRSKEESPIIPWEKLRLAVELGSN